MSLGVVCLFTAALPVRAAPPAEDRDVRDLAAQIDQLVGAAWKADGIQPATASSDAEFLRRVYLDLVGRIPSITVVRDFLDDPAPDKRAKLVRRLLQTDAHATHWANVWRAVMLPPNGPIVRNNAGFQGWLQQRIKDRVGWDQLVRELLTASPGNVRDQGTLTFYQANEQKAENLAAATSRLFLGVKLECAQCHDHPFAKWKRQQFWEYAAFFANFQGQGPRTQPPAPGSNRREITIPTTNRTVQARFLDGVEPTWKDGVDSRVTLADWVTAAENPFFARNAVNRLWEYFFGIGLIEPVDEPSDDNPPCHPELLDELARQFAAHQFDVSFLIRAITASKTYQLTSQVSHPSQNQPRRFARMLVRGLSPEQLFDSLTEAIGWEPGDGERGGRPGVGGLASSRAEFLARFPPQEKRTELQTSILQALYLMNGKFLADATTPAGSRNLATVLDAQGVSTARRIRELYLITLSRQPTKEETERLVSYVDRGGPSGDARKALTDVFWALLNSSEFFLNH
jgi:hypothetical protein